MTLKPTKSQAPVALITGAARRIGAEIAVRLHSAGFRVVIHYFRSESAAYSLTQKLNALKKDSALALKADLQQKTDVLQLVEDAVHWAGRMDALVNNASVFLRTDNTAADKNWDTLFTTNVKAPLWLSFAAFPHLAKHQGCIINITDIHAEKPLKGYGVYCATKAALTLQTKSLAREFAPDIRVNGVAPGAIAWPEEENSLADAVKKNILAKTPLKRHGSPTHIAQAVLSFIENDFITGQILSIDGGRSLN